MRRERSGFTLVEMVVSMALLTVVMAACVSITSLAARSMPGASDPTTETLDVRRALMRVAEELATAVEITEATSTSLIASVRDPNNPVRVYQVMIAKRDGPPISLVRVARSAGDVLADDVAGISITYAADQTDSTRIASAMITLTPSSGKARTIRHPIVFLARPMAP